MLKKFTVSGFKGFKNSVSFDFSDVKNYAFNSDLIKNNLINKCIVYGKNASGKSNIGLAIFDIVGTITDKHSGTGNYSEAYINAESEDRVANFEYEFLIDGFSVKYSFKKKSYKRIFSEKFEIDNNVFLERSPGKIVINLPGAEKLNLSDDVGENMSLIRYVKKNTIPVENDLNKAFHKFYDFVDNMLYFRSLEKNSYIGYRVGSRNILQDIVETDSYKDFEEFLKRAGIDVDLEVIEDEESRTIGVKFGGRTVPFRSIASTGTFSLTLFFYWLREFEKVSLLFIDEFDAFYHHALAKTVVEIVNKCSAQSILTTHNTSLMTNEIFRPDCCFIIDSGEIKGLHRRTEKELREAHNLEKMYIAGSF